MEQNTLISFRNIVKSFDGQVILKGVNLDINEKEFVTLLGPSGCGKTTLLRILGGFLDADEGSVIFDGEEISKKPSYERELNTVFQKYALFPHLSVYENIAFGLKIKKMSKDIIDQKVMKMLKLIGLEGYENKNTTLLSGGQQQRVAIARALVKMPRVLLLDEPLSNLDARLRLQTREEIRRIQKETGITTIFVTHDQEEAMSISDLIVVMKQGVVQQTGKPQEVYDNPKNLFVAKFLGTPPINLFDGEVRNEMLYLGNDPVLSVPGVSDQPVTVGIRPEGFIPSEDGQMVCQLRNVEVMGRDVSIVSRHSACQSETLRSILQSDGMGQNFGAQVRFRLKPGKVLLFRKDNEERIPFAIG